MLSYQQYLYETFDGNVSYTEDPERSSKQHRVYSFRINDHEYVVNFDLESYPDHDANVYIKSWDMSFALFTVDQAGRSRIKTKITGTGNQFQVFATVAQITKDFVKLYRPDEITFSADPGEPSRVSLYKRMAPMLAAACGFKFGRQHQSNAFTIYAPWRPKTTPRGYSFA